MKFIRDMVKHHSMTVSVIVFTSWYQWILHNTVTNGIITVIWYSCFETDTNMVRPVVFRFEIKVATGTADCSNAIVHKLCIISKCTVQTSSAALYMDVDSLSMWWDNPEPCFCHCRFCFRIPPYIINTWRFYRVTFYGMVYVRNNDNEIMSLYAQETVLQTRITHLLYNFQGNMSSMVVWDHVTVWRAVESTFSSSSRK